MSLWKEQQREAVGEQEEETEAQQEKEKEAQQEEKVDGLARLEERSGSLEATREVL